MLQTIKDGAQGSIMQPWLQPSWQHLNIRLLVVELKAAHLY